MQITDKITITNEDNMVLMSRYPDNYFDLAIVDPPYGISVNMQAGKKKGERARYEKKDWDSEIPPPEYFNELFRVSKNQIIFGGNYFCHILPPSMGWIVWNKGVPEGVSFSDFEMAYTSFNKAAKMARLPYAGFIGLEGKRIHPTEKPKKLYEWCLMNYAKSDYKIIDTHLGGGRIAEACYDMDFSLVACEIDSKYYNDSVNRLKNHVGQQKLF